MQRLLLILVVVLAFFLRFYKVTEIPPSLNWDETSIAYNAYSILKTGKDEWGESLPIHFRSYGEYKLPVQVYASIPGIAIFGLNELGVRITPVIYGTLTILVVYFLASLLLKNRWLGLVSAAFLAISPWNIHLTRASFESSFSVFWVTLGVLLFVKGLEKRIYWLFSILSLVLSIYTYNATRVFTPLLLFTLFYIYRKDIFNNFKVSLLCFLIFVVSMIPLLNFYRSGEATARLELVSITDDPGFVLRINERRGNLKLPQPIPRLVHNKVTHFIWVYSKNYLSHFSPNFLFVNGAGHKQHHVQGIGELYLFQAPFLLLGLFYLFKKKNKFRWLIISWLLLAFVPVAITIDSIPNALRTLIAVVPYQIITAYGFLNIKKIWVWVLIGIIFLISLGRYLNNYYNVYPIKYSRDWQYGYKQVIDYVKGHYNDYDLIVFSRHYGEPHMFTLFYTNWDPAKFQKDPNLIRFETYDWVRVLKFDKFYFPDLGDKETKFEDVRNDNPGKRILFIGKHEDFPNDFVRLKTIDFLNGDRAFDLIETR